MALEKRQKSTILQEALIPGIPDDVAQLILSLVPPSLIYLVSKSWRRLLYTPLSPPFLSLYTISLSQNNSLLLSSFDPVSASWLDLPSPPCLFSQHPSRYLPLQSASVSGNLVIFSATPAFSQPLIFDPSSKLWHFGPTMFSPRRWCAGGASCTALFIASGVGEKYSTRTARSVEKLNFDINYKDSKDWRWEKLGDLESERMSREAIGAIGWREKLLVADVTANEGVIYDTRTDTWNEMPDGMIRGWKGPAAAMDEETLYSVDDSKGILKRYNVERDCWDDVMWAKELRGAEQIAAGGGRVCVIRGSGGGIMVVNVVASPARFWILDSRDESHPIAIHILPRISQSDL